MKKTKGELTCEKILNAGLKLWPDVTLTTVAKETDLTHVTVLYHFPGESLKNAVAAYAVQQGASNVIVQLIGMKHPTIEHMSPTERRRHFNAI